MDLSEKSAVVTGAGNGIGRAIALALARQGVNVAIADIEAAAASEVAGEAERLGDQAPRYDGDDQYAVDKIIARLSRA
jgi:3-oxoacyl-[acyl-carrier protein] reductase